MFIEITATESPVTVTLQRPQDFDAFKVVLHQSAPTIAAERALADLGAPAPPHHVYVRRTVIERLAGPELTEDVTWQAGLEAMIAYAAKAGWTDEDGNIRAHVESPLEQWAP